ncbi:MAG TPA: transglutaminase N-terminal domain-containing protein, partial [Candidatus Didemnitutus sp.]|nr:transglutaminase N-terminal domain-containing protein [Candidatus Didemnitutus sp.]
MPTYQITHHTVFAHTVPAGIAWQMLQLQPRNEAAQECLDFQLEIQPGAPDLESRVDYFGNVRHFFTVREPHLELQITSQSIVRRLDPAPPLPGITPPPVEVRTRTDELVRGGSGFLLEQYRFASTYVPLLPGARRLAEGLDGENIPALVWLEQLGQRFAESFTFDAAATEVSTPLDEILEN